MQREQKAASHVLQEPSQLLQEVVLVLTVVKENFQQVEQHLVQHVLQEPMDPMHKMQVALIAPEGNIQLLQVLRAVQHVLRGIILIREQQDAQHVQAV